MEESVSLLNRNETAESFLKTVQKVQRDNKKYVDFN